MASEPEVVTDMATGTNTDTTTDTDTDTDTLATRKQETLFYNGGYAFSEKKALAAIVCFKASMFFTCTFL